jgi:hypothetical protein
MKSRVGTFASFLNWTELLLANLIHNVDFQTQERIELVIKIKENIKCNKLHRIAGISTGVMLTETPFFFYARRHFQLIAT